MKKSTTTHIGDILFKSGVPQVFGIYPNDNLSADSDQRVSLLFGFLKEAAEGNLQDPNNVLKWEKVGKSLYNP